MRSGTETLQWDQRRVRREPSVLALLSSEPHLPEGPGLYLASWNVCPPLLWENVIRQSPRPQEPSVLQSPALSPVQASFQIQSKCQSPSRVYTMLHGTPAGACAQPLHL